LDNPTGRYQTTYGLKGTYISLPPICGNKEKGEKLKIMIIKIGLI
jgi:hypothetical protein